MELTTSLWSKRTHKAVKYTNGDGDSCIRDSYIYTLFVCFKKLLYCCVFFFLCNSVCNSSYVTFKKNVIHEYRLLFECLVGVSKLFISRSNFEARDMRVITYTARI